MVTSKEPGINPLCSTDSNWLKDNLPSTQLTTLPLLSTNSTLHPPQGFTWHFASGWAGQVDHWQKLRKQVNMGLPEQTKMQMILTPISNDKNLGSSIPSDLFVWMVCETMHTFSSLLYTDVTLTVTKPIYFRLFIIISKPCRNQHPILQ